MNKTGTLFLIPSSLNQKPLVEVLNHNDIEIVKSIKTFVIETPKIARAHLKDLGLNLRELTYYELNLRVGDENINQIISILKSGENVALISDAGIPAVADIGSSLTKEAQKKGINVVTLSGPSSIVQALASSGLNGQQFTFHGYLSKEQSVRIKQLKELERVALQTGYTQIFIETPYRAQYMYEDIINHLAVNTKLTVAVDITMESEDIKTLQIQEWKGQKVEINKRQVVYIIGR